MNRFFVLGLTAGFSICSLNVLADDQPPTQAVHAPAKVAATSTAVKTTAASPAPVKPVEATVAEAPKYESLDNPAACFARGLANVSTCWLELPRCAIYDNAQVPFFGLIVGIPEGALFTVARALTGVADIVTFGAIGNAMYGNSFPDFIWESHWMPPKTKKK